VMLSYRIDNEIKKLINTLDEKQWDDFQYKSKDGKMRNLFADANGNLTVDSIKRGLDIAGVKLDARWVKDDDGYLSGKELTNAMTAAVQRTKARLDR
jgi:hypothetical protein